MGAEVLGQARLAWLLIGLVLGGQPRMRVSSRDCAYIHVLELSVQLSGPGSFLALRSVIHLKNLFCALDARRCSHRLDIRGRYKSLCEATV